MRTAISLYSRKAVSFEKAASPVASKVSSHSSSFQRNQPYKMSDEVYNNLFAALHLNDVQKFQSILTNNGLPSDGPSYELLMKALDLNHKPICHILLDNGCIVNKPGIVEKTPLHMVVQKVGWVDVVEKLLNVGADVMKPTAGHGDTALHLAFKIHASENVMKVLLGQLLKETRLQDVKNKDGLGFMHIACAHLDVAEIKQLVDAGLTDMYSQVSPLSNTPYAGYTLLHFAVKYGRYEVAEFLCQREIELPIRIVKSGFKLDGPIVSVYVQDRNGSTPIHLALECRDLRMIDLLFQYNDGRTNMYNHNGISHFMAACAASSDLAHPFFIGGSIFYIGRAAEKHILSARVKKIGQHSYQDYNCLNFAIEFCRIETIKNLLYRRHCLVTKELILNLTCDRCRETIYATLIECCRDCTICLNRIQNCKKIVNNADEVAIEIWDSNYYYYYLKVILYVMIVMIITGLCIAMVVLIE